VRNAILIARPFVLLGSELVKPIELAAKPVLAVSSQTTRYDIEKIDADLLICDWVATYRFLPPIKDHNIIDAQHTVVILLTLIMWSISFGSLLQYFLHSPV
jgi:hypothetical protein